VNPLRATLIRASESEALRAQVTARSLPRRVAMRYVAGERLDDGLDVARTLSRNGRQVTLDYVGESVTDEAEARAAAKVYVEALDRVGQESLPAGVSVKPTQMGLHVAEDLCRELLAEIAAAADRVGAHVTLDMEASDVTEATVGLVEHLQRAGHANVGCAVQSYLRRTRADIERLTAAGASLRLCKGAYVEPVDVAYQPRLEVDASFADCAAWLLEHGVYPRIATHDHRLIARVQNLAVRLGRRDDFEFQMLYGVRTALQRALVRDGWRLCVYVPFGSQWYPYFMRRLAERPANLALFLRSFVSDR
jgi:proline dehydrogenase